MLDIEKASIESGPKCQKADLLMNSEAGDIYTWYDQ